MMTKKKAGLQSRSGYWLAYTMMFVVLMVVVLSPFWMNGRTLITVGDSTSQYYPATVYIAHWYRDVFSNLLHGNFVLPTFDLTMVLGEDAYSTLTYYNLSNPLFMLGALVPDRWLYVFFQFCYVLQYYLAGLAFSACCFELGRGRWAALAGTMVYLSCGYMFKVGAMYIDFVTPLVCLPLLVLGFERILKGKSVLPMVFISWYAALNKIYFFYMCGLFLVLYGLIRGGWLYGLRRVKDWFLHCLKGVGAMLAGMALAGPFLLPGIACFFGSGRSGVQALSLREFLPTMERLRGLLAGSWMITEGPGRNNIALCAIAVLTVLLLVVRFRRRWPALCAGVLVMGLLYLMPVTDFVMNAFAGRNDRWVFLLAFVWALAVAFLFPALLELGKAEKLLLCAAALLALAYGVLGPVKLDPEALLAAGMMVLTVAALLLAQRENGLCRKFGPVLVCGVVLLNACAIGYTRFAPVFKGLAREGHTLETLAPLVHSPHSQFETVAGQVHQNYRIDNGLSELNTAMLDGYPGINGYWSLVNKDLLHGLRQMGMDTIHWSVTLSGDSDLIQTLLGVRYRMTKGPADLARMPGWSLTEQQGEHCLYEYDEPLPIAGYVYDRVITEEQYDALSPVQRQQAALQAAALAELPEGMAPAQPEDRAQLLEFVPTEENVHLENGILDLGWWSGKLRLDFEAPAGSYLMLELHDARTIQENIGLKIVSEGCEKRISMNEEPGDYVVDLGYSDAPRTWLELEVKAGTSFETLEDLGLGELRVYAVPAELIRTGAEQRSRNVLQDPVLTDNCITGRLELDAPGVLCVAIPYSRGWTAQLDGQDVPVQKVNEMLLGVAAPAGSHQVELRYHTPGLAAGWGLFAAGAVVLAVLIVCEKRTRRAPQDKKGKSCPVQQ